MTSDEPRRQQAYRALYFANFVTAMGMLCFLPFLPFHLESLGVHDRGELKVWTGLVFGAAPLTSALCGPLWGALGDRIGRRIMVIRALLGITLFVGLMAFTSQPWQLLLLRIGQGMFSGFVAPSMTLVSLIAPPERQTRTVTGVQSAMVLGACFGPALGACIREYVQPAGVFVVCSLLAFLSALIVWRYVEEPEAPRETMGGGLRASTLAMLRGLRGLLATRALRVLLLSAFLVRLAIEAVKPMIPLFISGELGDIDPVWQERLVGASFTAISVVTALALLWWGRVGERSDPMSTLAGCCIVCGLFAAPQALVHRAWLLIVLLMLMTTFYSGVMPLAYGLIVRHTKPSERGSGIGMMFLALNTALAIGPMLGGFVSQALQSVRPLFALSGALCVVVGSMLLAELRMRSRKVPKFERLAASEEPR